MSFDERIKAAVRASAAPVPEDFLWTTEQMIDRLPRKERIIVRNKLSYGLILAIILCMLTVTAVAAVLLTGQELVEQEVIPMALENDQAQSPLIFTNEELQRIVALAEENGVNLGENTLLALENGLDIPEREVIRELVYQDFGPEPMRWTLEEQYWFYEAMVELGVQKTNAHLLPGEGDLTEAEATALAKQYLADPAHMGDSPLDIARLGDPSAYTLHRSYQMAYDEHGNPTEPLWCIGFMETSPGGSFYRVLMDQEGGYIGIYRDVMEEATVNDTFSNAELAQIVAMAEENGIQLSSSILSALEKGEGYWEEEVIMSLAKSQFGPYPGQWTLEEQWWFEEVLVSIGYKEYNPCHIPAEGEMSYEEAYMKAKAHIAAQGYDTSALDDRTQYALWRSCYAQYGRTGSILCITWYFWFEPLDAALPSFDLEMNADGSLTMFNHKPGILEALESQTLHGNDVQDYFTNVYGSHNKWSPEVFVEYVTMLRQSDLTKASRGIRAFAATQFCLPPEGSLTTDQALAIAKETVDIEDAINCSFTCFMVDGRICWKVTMCQYLQVVRDMVEMDAVTGEILEVYKSDTGSSAQYYVPRSVWESIPQPDPEGLG